MKNKFLFVAFLVFCFSATIVVASYCNPVSPFTYCYESSYSYDCTNPTARIQVGDISYYPLSDGRYIDVTKKLDIRCDGSYFYLYDLSKMSQSQIDNSCGSSGCNGFITSIATNTNVQFQLNDYAPIKPEFVCFNLESKICRAGWSPSWSWTMSNIYFSDVYLKSQIQCKSDDQCGSTQFCNIQSTTKATCDSLVCDANSQLINHKCISTNLPKMCTDAGKNNIYECQDYVTKYITIINGDIESKVAQIANLQLTVDQYANIISNLTSIRDEQATLIAKLNLSIQQDAQIIAKMTQSQAEQAQIINGLNLTLAKQAELISNLNLKINEQASLINEMTNNLQIKAALIAQLTAENSKQAALIAEMEKSFTNQGIILNALNLTVADDARIISDLTRNVKEQGQIVNELTLTNQELKDLVTQLQVKNTEMAAFVAELQNNLEYRDQLIQDYNVTIQQYQAALAGKQQQTNYVAIFAVSIIVILSFTLFYVVKKRKRR